MELDLEKDYKKIGKTPSMNPKQVHEYLHEIGKNWTGQGVVVELGSWLGGSAISLLEGLVEADYNRTFYAFDRWRANDGEVRKANKQGSKIHFKQDLKPIFLNNVKEVYENILAVQGNIEKSIHQVQWPDIEICIFDAPKKNPIFSKCIRALAPYWIPGVTILGLMDYHHHKKFSGKAKDDLLAPVNFINNNKECFEMIKDFQPAEPVFFKLIKQLEL